MFMFYDADAHWHPPVEIFKDLPQQYQDRVKDNITRMDLNKVWKDHYDNIKDASWPDCDLIADFHKLPTHVKQEIKDTYPLPYMYVSDDLNFLHIDNYYNQYPDTETHRQTLKHFLKVDKQLLNPPTRILRFGYLEEPKIAVESMKAYNRALLELCNSTPEFDGTLWLALQDFDSSMKELEENIDKNFFGVFLSERPSYPFIPKLYPLFEKCAQHRMPVYLHFIEDSDPPLDWEIDLENPRYKMIKERFPFLGDTWSRLIIGFITEGILDRLPELRLVFAEKSMRELAQVRTVMMELGWPDPLPYFRKNCWFTFDIEEPGMIEVAREIGWDRMMLGTDHPHSTGPGGKNRFKDVDMLNDLLAQGKITAEDHAYVSHKNYILLKERK